jgi:hypothetical protein
MSYTFEFHQQLAELVAEEVGLQIGYKQGKIRTVNLLGLTRHNLILQVLYAVKDAQWKLRIMCNSPKKNNKNELIEHSMADLVGWNTSEFYRNNSDSVQYEIAVEDADSLLEQASVLRSYIEENDLGQGSATNEVKVGVSFRGTQFDRLKERGATMSGMFGNLVCQASGMNLLMTQAEYYVGAGEIDGVEFDESGKVISIYECQSGIHHGEELDDAHLGKVLGSYLYDSEIISTVRKVVILAGAYDDLNLNILRNRKLELARRDQQIELVALVTVREGDRIGVVRVDLG